MSKSSRRMIDPEFWQSETMASLPLEIRLLFIGIFSTADIQGRLRGNPAIIRATIFPLDDPSLETIQAGLNALEEVNSIVVYQADGKIYIQVVNWWKYQNPQWASPSDYPPPDGWQDRLRYRNSNKVLTENWDQPGGFQLDAPPSTPDIDPPDQSKNETGSGSQTQEPLPKALPKALPEVLPKPIELELELEIESVVDFKTHAPTRTHEREKPKPELPPATPATKKEKTPFQKIAEGILNLCRYDKSVLNRHQLDEVKNTARSLYRAGVDPPQLIDFEQWWYKNDWRGQRGQPPTPLAIQAKWGHFKTHKNGNGVNNGPQIVESRIVGLRTSNADNPIQKRTNIKTGETYYYDNRTRQRVPGPIPC